MVGIVSSFPESWREDITVLRGGERDRLGKISPEEEIPLEDCLIGQRSTQEPDPTVSAPVTDLSLYRDPDPNFSFRHTDRIRRANGDEYQVDGKPKVLPLGVEVPLKEV